MQTDHELAQCCLQLVADLFAFLRGCFVAVEQLDVIEINEASAAVVLASAKELGIWRRTRQHRRRRHRGRSPHRNVRGTDHPARSPLRRWRQGDALVLRR